jgi:molecular chaperone GrpE
MNKRRRKDVETTAREQQEEPAGADVETAAGGSDLAAGASTGAGQETERQVAELKDKWLRARAELENVRRTARQEVELAHRYGASPALLGVLGVLDNLQRALDAPPESVYPDYLAGLRLIEQQFCDVLTTCGVERVPGQKGTPFDPSVHRALLEQETDEVPPGTILTVAVEGYRLHDRLLREAQVVVAKAPATEPPRAGPEAPPPGCSEEPRAED